MKNNKPEWLLKAEEEQAKFLKTKFGKMSQKEYEFHERQSHAGKSGGSKTVAVHKESGYFQSEEWKQSQSKGGKTSGDNNVKSGHWAKVGAKHGNTHSHAHITCPKCGHTGSTRNIKPIHFNNCIYPKMLEIISNYIKPDEELSIIKLSEAISKDLNVSRGRVETMLKRNFVEPGIKPSRYPKWKLKQNKNT